MPFVFRKIRKAKWLSSFRPSWLNEGELQADALVDIRTSNNELSVYIIDDEKSNIERVAAALAATADNTANVDYVLLDIAELTKIGIEFVQTQGDTQDDEVNAAHVDLVRLGTSKLLVLAQTLSTKGEIGRIKEKIIIDLIIQNIKSGHILQGGINLSRAKNFWRKLDTLS